MSLLIKALEQAAKDRKAARVEAAAEDVPAPAPASGEPTLEPPPPPRTPVGKSTPPRQASARASAPGPPQESAAAPARQSTSLSMDRDTPERRPASSLSDLARIDAQQQRARAAAVMQAGSGSAAQAIAFLRGNPVAMIATLGVVVGLVFGIYVYLQIAKPGVFVRQAATRPQDQSPAPAPAQAPSPVPAPSVPSGMPETAAPGGAAVSGGPVVEVLPQAAAPGISGTIGAPAPAAPGQIPAASVIGAAPPIDTPRTSAAERAAEARRDRGSFRASEPRQPAPPAAPATPATLAPVDSAPAGRERITVSSSTAQPRLNPLASQAYLLLQSGNLEEARGVYNKLSQAEPLNIDALLGLAYIASQENRSDDAMKLYLRILQLNPRHAVAQGALIGLMGRADPAASESRLRQLIAREPSAFLHFVLGNLYADQSQWTQAQQSYFQAHHLEPDNPDYAYNLAVGLDHLRQAKLALNFYRRAEQHAAAQGRSNFNLSHARERIRILSSQLE